MSRDRAIALQPGYQERNYISKKKKKTLGEIKNKTSYKKSSDKIYHPFIIQILSNLEIVMNYLNLIKSILEIRNKARMFTLTAFIQLVLESLAKTMRQENRIEGMQFGNK